MNNIQLPRLKSNVVNVGGGFSVQFVVRSYEGDDYVNCEWSPCKPSSRDFKRKINMDLYHDALAEFTLRVLQRPGIPV